MKKLPKELRKYFQSIGKKGGQKSRRSITPEQQAMMQSARKKKGLSGGTQ